MTDEKPSWFQEKVNSFRKFILGADVVNCTTNTEQLRQQIDELNRKVEELKSKTISADEAAGNAKLASLMQRNDVWAIHYSTVRMTIGTFVITTCIGIIGFRYDDPSLQIIIPTTVLWLLAYILFFIFTYHVYCNRSAGDVKKNMIIKNYIEKDIVTLRGLFDPRNKHGDWPLLIFTALTIFYIGYIVFLWFNKSAG
ncbi:MAG: hypothetical protein AAF546_10860 [Verrucomicrobiota bacterium]